MPATTRAGAARKEITDIEARVLAATCAVVADEKKGREVVVREVSGVLDLADYFVVATGTSHRQLRSIAEEIVRRVGAAGGPSGRVEGLTSGWWVLLDFGSVVVHVFSEEARRHYDLDLLWADAPLVEWREVGEASATAS